MARLGGDKFAVACSTGMDEAAVLTIADRLGETICRPIELGDRLLVLTACIGIAVANGEGSPSTGVGGPGSGVAPLRDADTALHCAKEHGRASVETFYERVRARAISRLEVEADLRRAVSESEFLLHYQPAVSVAGGRIVGVEALVRWDHPEHGIVAPSRFIPLAEETGLIVPIGELVLREACRQTAAWSVDWPERRPLGVAVNISGRQLSCPNLVEQVRAALDDSGLEPSLLTLEITESVLMADGPAAADVLARLRALGVRLGVDDFGTGYSSLLYLRRFPFDVIKIDRAFVAGLGVDPEDSAIVEGVVGLAHALGLPATAEGVERRLQLDVLRSFGCDLAQGFYISKPLPPAELVGLLDDWARRADADQAG